MLCRSTVFLFFRFHINRWFRERSFMWSYTRCGMFEWITYNVSNEPYMVSDRERWSWRARWKRERTRAWAAILSEVHGDGRECKLEGVPYTRSYMYGGDQRSEHLKCVKLAGTICIVMVVANMWSLRYSYGLDRWISMCEIEPLFVNIINMGFWYFIGHHISKF